MKAKIMALALLSSALLSTEVAALTTHHTIGCWAHNGNFNGLIKYTKTVQANDTVYHFYKYAITRHNGQKGGNKANINIEAHSSVAGQGYMNKFYKSPDNRPQDGKWHDTSVTFAVRGKPQDIYYFNTHVQFIFDKSGSDPSCWAYND